MSPAFRRLADDVTGDPVELGARVVTPRARRRGWVVAAGRWAALRMSARPSSLTIDDGAQATTVRIPDRQRQLTIVMWVVTAMLIARRWRRSR